MGNLLFKENEILQDFITKNTHAIQDLLNTSAFGGPPEEIAYQLIHKLNEALNASDNLVKILQAPIIPSIVPNTILIPIIGQLTAERFESIRTKILNNLRDIDTVVVDFTGINGHNISEIGIESMSSQISQLNAALHLMGVEPIYVGFSPEVIKGIIYSGIDVNHLNCQLTFKTALQYLMKKKNIVFAEPI